MYLDIGEYGVVGNGRTAVLVGRDGSIDWGCLPRFDSPAIFGALLDDEVGGHFAVTLCDGSPARQRYEDETNVLQTELSSPDGRIRVTDFLPAYMDRGEMEARDEICRFVECLEGHPRVRIEFDPALDYARGNTTLEAENAGCVARSDDRTACLESPVSLTVTSEGAVGERRLAPGEEFWLVCRHDDANPQQIDPEAASTALDRTREYWRLWCERAAYDGPYSDAVGRSALALKLLTYEETGAVVAAATTSLPEMPGGSRNWDYRYTWIRDSIFSAWSFYQLDYHELGIQFIDLLEAKLDPTEVPPMVDVEGDPVPTEVELDHLEGYRGASPVRIGNRAANQEQWDAYGMMVDGAYFAHRKLGGVESEVYESFVRPAVDHMCEVWEEPDHGIWEVRGGKQQFTSSKLWCWVALDRGIEIARAQGYRGDVDRWRPHREEIRESILEHGWSESLEAFRITYETDALDASVLLMPLVGFLPSHHPKMRRTIEAIETDLADGPLVYRYRPEAVPSDPIDEGDSAFTTCSFWLIACLARLGRLEDAKTTFEDLLEYANHVGLYAEELDASTGDHLGNFPQAYVHMGLINAAMEIDRARP